MNEGIKMAISVTGRVNREGKYMRIAGGLRPDERSKI